VLIKVLRSTIYQGELLLSTNLLCSKKNIIVDFPFWEFVAAKTKKPLCSCEHSGGLTTTDFRFELEGKLQAELHNTR
jgi:hypothetical protein